MQRALMQYNKPQNRLLVQQALKVCGRTDLIGMGRDCLIPPRDFSRTKSKESPANGPGARERAKPPARGEGGRGKQKGPKAQDARAGRGGPARGQTKRRTRG